MPDNPPQYQWHYADSGVVPGSGDGDTVPAMLTPGDLVLTRQQRQQYERSAADPVFDVPLTDTPGTGKVPAMLTPGELIITPDQYESHAALIDSIRGSAGSVSSPSQGEPLMSHVQHFAGGGLVMPDDERDDLHAQIQGLHHELAGESRERAEYQHASGLLDQTMAGAQGSIRPLRAGYLAGQGSLRGGMMVASLGISEAEHTNQAINQQQEALNVGDSVAYAKATHEQYSGFGGGLRYYGNKVAATGIKALTLGMAGTDPDDEIKEADQAADAQIKQQQNEEQSARGQVFQSNLKNYQEKAQDELQEVSARDTDTRQRGKTSRELRDTMKLADKLEQQNVYEAGFLKAGDTNPEHERKAQAAQTAAVKEMRDTAQAKAAAEDSERSSEQFHRMGEMGAHATESRLRMAGDMEGAERKQFTLKMDEQSLAAHKRSVEEGAKFDKDVRPQLQAEFDANANRKRVNDERNANDEVIDINARSTEAKMRMAGDLQGAERKTFTAAQDDRIESTQKAADQEQDVVKKAQLQKVADATKAAAPAELAEFDQKQQKEKVEDAQHAQDQITQIEERASVARLRASGDTYGAEKAEKFAALDEQTQKTQEAADAEQDVTKKASLQKVADATKAAAVSEKQSFQDNAGREDQEGARRMQEDSTAQAMEFSGNKEDAALYRAATEARREQEKLQREGRPEEAKAVGAEFQEKKDELAYQKESSQLQRDTREQQSAARAGGKGKLAEYEGFREKEAEMIRDAEKTGDQGQIEQARRTAANDTKAWEKEHREQGHMYNSLEDWSAKAMFGQGSNGGMREAMKQAKQDERDLQGRGHFKEGESGEKLNRAAEKIGSAHDKFERMLDNAMHLVVLDR